MFYREPFLRHCEPPRLSLRSISSLRRRMPEAILLIELSLRGATEAKQSTPFVARDCHVAPLLAMTKCERCHSERSEESH